MFDNLSLLTINLDELWLLFNDRKALSKKEKKTSTLFMITDDNVKIKDVV